LHVIETVKVLQVLQ